MSVLVDHEIKELVDSCQLIEYFEESSMQGASYDMRLGQQFMKHGSIKTLTDEDPSIVLEPGEFTILTSLEILKMPLNMIGHNGILSTWAKRGLVSLFSPQIDPGFWGILIVPVFNAGDAPISITLGEKIFTVEFETATSSATYGWSERHGKQNRISSSNTPFVTRPNLADISKVSEKVVNLEEIVRQLQNESVNQRAELQVRPTLVDLSKLSEKVEKLEEIVRQLQNESTSQRAELRQKDAEIHTELSSNLRILENRISDLIVRRQLRWVWISVLIAVSTLLVGILSTPWLITWIHSIIH